MVEKKKNKEWETIREKWGKKRKTAKLNGKLRRERMGAKINGKKGGRGRSRK